MTWTQDELERIGRASELRIAGRRKDGTLRRLVIIWAVRVGDAIYARSVHGPDGGWFRGGPARVGTTIPYRPANPRLTGFAGSVWLMNPPPTMGGRWRAGHGAGC